MSLIEHLMPCRKRIAELESELEQARLENSQAMDRHQDLAEEALATVRRIKHNLPLVLVEAARLERLMRDMDQKR